MRAIVPLAGEPTFRPYPFRLRLDGAVSQAVADAIDLIERTPGRFNGPIAFCHGISREGAILRRPGRYSEALVVFEEPTLGYRLGFALGVQLFVERDDGLVLFQRRGPRIGRDPLLWTASASGGLKPDEDPRTAVLEDASEEIGLAESDLPDLRPVAVCTNEDTGSALVVYHARLRDGAKPSRNPERVAEIRWKRTPGEVGGQVSGDTLASWEALERWREKDRDRANAAVAEG